MKDHTRTIAMTFSLLLSLASALPAMAGLNDFFGNSLPNTGASGGASPSMVPSSGQAVSPTIPMNSTMTVPQDFTDDEKRMQKKFKSNQRAAKDLIEQGQKMMASPNPKIAKKGKIKKEIGEKWLADLQSQNPIDGAVGTDIGLNKPVVDSKPDSAATK